MEIERKWLVTDWPQQLPLIKEEIMRQGYISPSPTVRIREEVLDGRAEYVLCLKSKGTLARKEIEIRVTKEEFSQLEDLIGLPLIPKVRRTYLLPDGHHLEVSIVDEGMPTAFMYAEIEYASVDEALAWKPETEDMAAYLSREVTNEPGQTMGAYWAKTRLQKDDKREG